MTTDKLKFNILLNNDDLPTLGFPIIVTNPDLKDIILIYLANLQTNLSFAFKYRGVEQLVARRAHNPKVVGSSPAPATKKDSMIFLS